MFSLLSDYVAYLALDRKKGNIQFAGPDCEQILKSAKSSGEKREKLSRK
jgi:hypothetical protein